ncbi:MAG: hypothetical protein ABEI80_10650 [Haloplanus sp.]
MGDPTSNGAGVTVHGRSVEPDGGVHFEEAVALSDSAYAGLSKVATAVALVSVLGMVLVVPLALVVFFVIAVVVSGNSVVDLLAAVASGLPLSLVLFGAVFGIVVVGSLLAAVVMVVKGGGVGLGSSEQIHTRVTDSAVEIDREGGYLGQSSGVTIPFETVTTVEYNDPDGDLRMNLGDVRAKKFIGGRGGDWVRIGRSDGPAVYVGSDQPRRLADVVAGLSPGVDRAEPFS